MLIVATLTFADTFAVARRAYTWFQSHDQSFKSFYDIVFLAKESELRAEDFEYTGLVNGQEHEEPTEYETETKPSQSYFSSPSGRHAHFAEAGSTTDVPLHADGNDSDDWSNEGAHTPEAKSYERSPYQRHTARQHSVISDRSDITLRDPSSPISPTPERSPSPAPESRKPTLRRIASAAVTLSERLLVFLAWVMMLSGISVYTGICRQNYLNGCLAHLISQCLTLASFYFLITLTLWQSQRARYSCFTESPRLAATSGLLPITDGHGIVSQSLSRSGLHPRPNSSNASLSSSTASRTPGWSVLVPSLVTLTARSRFNILASRSCFGLLDWLGWGWNRGGLGSYSGLGERRRAPKLMSQPATQVASTLSLQS